MRVEAENEEHRDRYRVLDAAGEVVPRVAWADSDAGEVGIWDGGFNAVETKRFAFRIRDTNTGAIVAESAP